jgi:hypothetical protein
LRGKHLLHNQILGWSLGASQALLNDVGTELVTRQLADATLEHLNHRLGKSWLIKVNDVLDDIITKRILHQDPCVVSDALNQPALLIS